MDVRLPFFTETVAGLQQACEKLKKNLLLHGVSRDSGSEAIYRELIDGTVDGLVVAMPPDDPLIEMLAADHLPVVAVADAISGIPSVVVDDIGGASMLADHIAGLGHRFAVFATALALPFSAKRRQQSFIETAVSNGMDVVVRPLGADEDLPDFVLRAIKIGATAIVAWNDTDARRIIRACRRVEIRVPQDLAVVGFDGCPLPYDDLFPLTTVRAPWAEVAHQSVMLLDRLSRKEPCPAVTTMSVEFVKGATT
jgi:DNA-binding LacI/PurR family transcriptional regulator